jgi:4-amino-4-deoxy-L-arabinose transferase-like glycosyltransferase
MKNFIKKYKLEIFIFSLALIARLALFSINYANGGHNFLATIHGDDGYYELSQGILNGHGFSWDATLPYHPNPLRPPVWPYLIAFFVKVFGSYKAPFVFELLLGSMIPVLAFWIASRLFGRRVGKWTALIICLEPYLVLFSFILYTETSFIFFFLISILFFLRYVEKQTLRNAVWFGVFLSLAILVKPTVEFLPILIPIGLAVMWRKSLTKEHLKHLVVFIAVFVLFMTPWLYRNHVEFGKWGISAQPAFNLYVYLVPTVLAIDNHTSFQAELDKQVGKAGISADEITLTNSAQYKAKAYAVLAQHKLALVKSSLTTVVTFFTHDGMLTVLGYAGIQLPSLSAGVSALSLVAHPMQLVSVIGKYIAGPGSLILIMRLFWIVVMILFFFGVYRFFRREGMQTAAVAALCIVAYFAVTTAINGMGVNARFRMPVDVFILGFALYGLLSLKRDNTQTVTA